MAKHDLSSQTAAVLDAVDEAEACARPLLLTGDGVHDILLNVDGRPRRIVDLLVDHLHDRGVAVYSPARGADLVVEPARGSCVPTLPAPGEEPDAAARRLVAASAAGLAVIIDHADDLLGASTQGLGTHPTERMAREMIFSHGLAVTDGVTPGPIVLIDRSGDLAISASGRSGRLRTQVVPLPDADTLERAAVLLALRAEEHPTEFAAMKATSTEIARAARGLRIEDLVETSRRCAADHSPFGLDRILAIKAVEMPRRSGGALRLHTDEGASADITNLPNIQRLIGELESSRHWPLGVCLAGPPGTGKSYAARVIATRLGLPLVSLHMVMDRWVGASEQRIEAALSTIEALAPVVLWIDEIDRVYLGQRSEGSSSDGGTSERVQAALFSFIDPRLAGRVLFLGTSNRPDLMDAASRDRFKTMIPLLLPTACDRARLVNALAQRLGRSIADGADLDALASSSQLDATTVRDLHELVSKASRIAGPIGLITGDHLRLAVERTLPRDERAGAERMTLHALRLTADTDYLPWTVGPDLDRSDLPPFVSEVVDSHGRPEQHLINQRIAILTGR